MCHGPLERMQWRTAIAGAVLCCMASLSVGDDSRVCHDEAGCDGANEGDYTPLVRLVQGEALECAESATVMIEYETWHVDPADPGYHVTVSFHLLPQPHEHWLRGECTASETELNVVNGTRPYFTHEFKESVRSWAHGRVGQVLIENGTIPGLSVPMSRLSQGLYWVGLQLLRKYIPEEGGRERGGGEGHAAEEGVNEHVRFEPVAEGGAVLRVMRGKGNCLRRSLANDYCRHGVVDPILQALDLEADQALPDECAALLRDHGRGNAGQGGGGQRLCYTTRLKFKRLHLMARVWTVFLRARTQARQKKDQKGERLH